MFTDRVTTASQFTLLTTKSSEFMLLIESTSEEWKVEMILKPLKAFDPGTWKMEIQCPNTRSLLCNWQALLVLL